MANGKTKGKLGYIVLIVLLLAGAYLFTSSRHSWEGIDEAVVKKIAKEHGREAKPPLIDPGSGDLLLLGFLLAGAVGGFAAGYYWRDLTGKDGK